MRWVMVCLMLAMVAGCCSEAVPRRSMEDDVERELELARLRMEVSGLRAITSATGEEVDLDPQPDPQFVEVNFEPEESGEVVEPPAEPVEELPVEPAEAVESSQDAESDAVDSAAVDVAGGSGSMAGVSDAPGAGGVVVDPAPVVRWSVDQPVAAAEVAERLPRIVMLSAEWCGPCRTTKEAAGDLIGVDESAVVQVVDVDKRPGYGAEFNVMQAGTIPAYFVYRGDGKRITALRQGASTRAGLEGMATQAGVSLQPMPEVSEGGLVTAAVEAAPRAGSVLQLLADHVERSQEAEPLVGGLLDIDVDVPDALPEVLAALVLDGTWRSESMGLELTLPESAALSKSGRRLAFSEPLLVSVERGPVSVSAELHGITLAVDGREVCLDLRGRGLLPVPDLTVVFR